MSRQQLMPLSVEVRAKALRRLQLSMNQQFKRNKSKPLSPCRVGVRALRRHKLAMNQQVRRNNNATIFHPQRSPLLSKKLSLRDQEPDACQPHSLSKNKRKHKNEPTAASRWLRPAVSPISTTTSTTRHSESGAALCYVLLCMGALMHAEPAPRASLRLFRCDRSEASQVLFFAYLLGVPPGLATRWLYPYIQKRIFSYLVGVPPHFIGLWNVGAWLKEDEATCDTKCDIIV